jgi:50S ribosomal subunit-associated GTPase HflX
VVDDVLADLGLERTPLIHVFNKMDLVRDAAAVRARVSEQYEGAVCVSATTGAIGHLRDSLERVLNGRDSVV